MDVPCIGLHSSTTLVVTVPICEWTCSCVQNKVCTFPSWKTTEWKTKKHAVGLWWVGVCSTPLQQHCELRLPWAESNAGPGGPPRGVNLVATTLVLGKITEAGCCWWLAYAVKTVADPGYGIKPCLYIFFMYFAF